MVPVAAHASQIDSVAEAVAPTYARPMAETFTAGIELFGKTATGFHVPPAVVEALGAGKRPPVVVMLNGHTYRSTIAPYGDDFFLPLNRKNRDASGLAAGDTVEVTIEHDDEPRVIEPPDDFADALSRNGAARATFEAFSYSHQREYVEWIEDAKKQETRDRRIAKALQMLAEGRTHR